jgi:anti-sigma factor RsiW
VNEQDKSEFKVRCEAIEELAILHACDELEPSATAALETHTAVCPACAAVVSREASLDREIASLNQPADSLDRSGLLLAQCRSAFAETLDDQQAKSNPVGWRPVFSPLAWWNVLRDTLVYHPAMSMAALVVVGFLAGVVGQRTRIAPPNPPSPRPVVTASIAAPKFTEQQMRSAASANVAWVTPSGSQTPNVQVQFMSQEPMNIVGPPDDADVLRALTFVLGNDQRFEPGVRMDSLEVLHTRCADSEVLRAVCTAARLDRNPRVRIKALDTLQEVDQNPMVRETVIEALQNDENAAVRAEAIHLLINVLRAEATSGAVDPKIVSVLRERLRNDPDNYIRMQSAAVLRQLNTGMEP